MNKLGAVKDLVRRTLRKRGYNIYAINKNQLAELENYEGQFGNRARPQPLETDLSKLRDLKARYAKVQLPVGLHSVWGAKGGTETNPDIGWGGVDLRSFRGHNAYVWSYAGADPLSARLRYYIYAEAARRKDPLRLLEKLREDGAFGCLYFDYSGFGSVSRDLLDSVIEINFLHKYLKVLDVNDLNVLDIGAGYGRMAHRMLEATDRINSYTCVDAVPESTFLCEFYLKHRNLLHRANVVPLDNLETELAARKYDLALNIHSFSECTFAAIEWWLTQLKRRQVRNLLIVPNDPKLFRSREADGARRDYTQLLVDTGYELVAQESMLDDPAARETLNVEDNMFLFQLRCA